MSDAPQLTSIAAVAPQMLWPSQRNSSTSRIVPSGAGIGRGMKLRSSTASASGTGTP